MLSRLGVLLLSLATGTAAMAADGERKAFALPDNSKLELTIPPGWKDELKPIQASQGKQDSPAATIALAPRDGPPFEVYVAPVARQRPGASADTAIRMRLSVQQAADKIKPSALEHYLPVEPLPGTPGPGYYFSATDREAKPGEFKYLTRGMLLVGDAVVSFSILTNDGQENVKDQALALLKSASHMVR